MQVREEDPAGRRGAAHARSSSRFVHVDGLRALAALAVALFHFYGLLSPLAGVVPGSADVLLRHGYLGVNVFFVLSGFVISHSLRGARYSLRFVGRFALRRQLRLDPPYWITLGVAALALARTPGLPEARLARSTIVAHVFYLQNVLGYPNVLDVFWTLCIEVQLYLAFVLLMWAAQALGGGPSRRHALLALTTLASLLLAAVPLPDRIGAWFVWYWYMFALGVLARAALDDRRLLGYLGLLSALALWRSLRFHGAGPALAGATAWLLVIAARVPAVARALSRRPLVQLGNLSYSFYLLHALAGGAAIQLVMAPGSPGPLRAALALAAALVASTAAAFALSATVERPAMAWSRRVVLAAARAPQAHRDAVPVRVQCAACSTGSVSSSWCTCSSPSSRSATTPPTA